MPEIMTELDYPPGVTVTFCEPNHFPHTSTHGLRVCPTCRVWHHDDFPCLVHASTPATIASLPTGPAWLHAGPRTWCDECDDYHNAGEDCPREVTECETCQSDHARGADCPREWCSDCDDYHDRDRWGDVTCPGWYCEDCEERHDYGDDCPRPYCADCNEYHSAYDSCHDGVLQDYDYTPDLQFMGVGPAYYGLEVEVTAYGSTIGSAVDSAQSRDTDGILYFKEDGSVSGFEMVTHPMSYDYAMQSFPWEVLSSFERNGCEIIDGDNGIHVHVSRAAFSHPSHLYRWMKLIYRNEEHCERIARRHSGQWAPFRSTHRDAHLEHIKFRKARDRGVWTEDGTQFSRYAAINTTNDATLEVRIFASTLNVRDAQAALQLVAASVEYTRHLTTRAIVSDAGWSWQAFRAWFCANGYTALSELDVATARRRLWRDVSS